MRIVRYTPALQEEWDDFVRNRSRNGTIFHEQRFLSYHGDRFEDCSVMVVEGKNPDILAVLPAAVITEGSKKGIVSHPGSTYGGVIFKEGIRLRKLKETLGLLIKYYCDEYGAGYLRMILSEQFHTGDSFEELTFLLWHRGFQIESKEVGIAKNLKELGVNTFSNRAKEYIISRNAEGAEIEHKNALSDGEISACYEIIRGNLNARHGKSPAHSMDELLRLKRMYNSRINIFYSIYRRELIASVVVFELNKKTVHCFYIAQNYNYCNLQPLLWLFNYVLHYYSERGYSFFNFGISSRGKWIKWGILEFKEKFGGRILTRDLWVLNNMTEEWPDDGSPKK